MRRISLSSTLVKNPKLQQAMAALAEQIAFYRECSVLVFASASQRDGADVMAIECAKALAARGKNVLLIDTNLRRPAREDAVPGLSEYLSDQVDRGDILCMTDHPHLYAIPSGAAPPNPTDLLSAKAFGSLLSGARATFDYVILPTAPLGEHIDGALVAVRCDGAILSLSSRRTKEKDALNAKRLLKKAGCRILGAVLNRSTVPERAPKEPEPPAEKKTAPKERTAHKAKVNDFDEDDET